MQDRSDAGRVRCRTGQMQDRLHAIQDVCSKVIMLAEQMQDWMDAGQERKRQMQDSTVQIQDRSTAVQDRCRIGKMQNMMYAGQDICSTVQMQDGSNAVQNICRTRQMQNRTGMYRDVHSRTFNFFRTMIKYVPSYCTTRYCFIILYLSGTVLTYSTYKVLF